MEALELQTGLAKSLAAAIRRASGKSTETAVPRARRRTQRVGSQRKPARILASEGLSQYLPERFALRSPPRQALGACSQRPAGVAGAEGRAWLRRHRPRARLAPYPRPSR